MKRITPALASGAVAAALLAPFSAFALFDFGGLVLNVPSAGGAVGHAAQAAASTGGTVVIYPPCVNGVEEVDQKQALGVPQPPVLMQFVGQYTFLKGPATHPGQQILGKYLPFVMPCIAIFLIPVPCPPAVCIIPTPLPLFFAPLILYNGSSI